MPASCWAFSFFLPICFHEQLGACNSDFLFVRPIFLPMVHLCKFPGFFWQFALEKDFLRKKKKMLVLWGVLTVYVCSCRTRWFFFSRTLDSEKIWDCRASRLLHILLGKSFPEKYYCWKSRPSFVPLETEVIIKRACFFYPAQRLGELQIDAVGIFICTIFL